MATNDPPQYQAAAPPAALPAYQGEAAQVMAPAQPVMHAVPMQTMQTIQPVAQQLQCTNTQCRQVLAIHPSTAPGTIVACPHCQTKFSVPAPPTMAATAGGGVVVLKNGEDPEAKRKRKKKKKKEKEDAQNAMIIFILGWFTCFAWFGFFIYWSSSSSEARNWSRASLCGLCCVTLCVLMPIIIFYGFIGTAVASTCAYGYC